MKNLGAIASRFLSITLALNVVGLLVLLPNAIDLANSAVRDGDAPRYGHLAALLLVMAVEFLVAFLLWVKADRFVPATEPKVADPITIDALKRLLFAALGVFLLSVASADLAGDLAAMLMRFPIGANVGYPSWVMYLVPTIKGLIGLGLILSNRPVVRESLIIRAANWPRNDLEEPGA